MRVMVTAGGTREYIDDIRVLTNISTGALGCTIAEEFLSNGHEVIYVHSKGAQMPSGRYLTCILADNITDAYEVMKEWTPKVNAVVHAMAVSDFTFNRTHPVKLKSTDLEGFIEHMRANVVKAPKILPNLKHWNPDAKIIGFKFEVGKTKEELLEIAKHQLWSCDLDYTFANDKKMIQDANSHNGWLIDVDGNEIPCYNKPDIARKIVRELTGE